MQVEFRILLKVDAGFFIETRDGDSSMSHTDMANEFRANHSHRFEGRDLEVVAIGYSSDILYAVKPAPATFYVTDGRYEG